MISSDEYEVSQKIKTLRNATTNQRVTLNDLEQIIGQNGIDKTNLLDLFNIVFDVNTTLQNNEKRFIIKKLLIPNGTYSIDSELSYKIISQVGYPRVYYHYNKKIKQKKLSLTLQTCLLEWLISFIHLFGKDIFKKLHRIMSLLFNILSFEYSRHLVVNLIFLIVLNNNSTSFKEKANSVVVKQWQIQLVVDMYIKFPLDDSLKMLLVLFKEVIPSLDYKNFTNYYNLSNISKISKFIKYPNMEYLSKLKQIQPEHAVNQQLLTNYLNQYTTFNRMLKKRRKLSPLEEINDIEILNPEKGSIHDIHSLESLTLELRNFDHLNFSELVHKPITDYNNKFRIHCLILKCLQDIDDSVITKFTSYIDNHIQQSNKESIQFNDSRTQGFLIRMAELNYLIPELLQSSNFLEIFKQKSSDFKLNLAKIKLLRGLSLKELSTIQPSVLFDLKSNKNNESLITAYFYEVSIAILNAGHSLSNESAQMLGELLKNVFDLFDKYQNTFTLPIKLTFIKVLRAIQDIELHCLITIGNELFPIPIINKLILDPNPLVVSEICGYISFIKKLELSDSLKPVQNHLLMDTLNFIWRDKAFAYEEGSHNKGLFLHPKFIDNLPTLNTFGYSSLTQLNTIGNLFHNPAWSYLTAEVVWKLEDKVQDINRRHPGPISEESVDKILRDANSKWIDMDYDTIKVEVLRQLDKYGYVGLGDLLFNSLRSLMAAGRRRDFQ